MSSALLLWRRQLLPKARAELKERLKRGGTDLKQVLKDAEDNEILGKMKVSALLEALPKVGKVKAQEIMTELNVTVRLRGLGDRQRQGSAHQVRLRGLSRQVMIADAAVSDDC